MDYSVFWCRLNKYYLTQWLEYFRTHSFVDNAYLIATCEVTDRAKQKRIKLAKKKIAEWYHIYLTWCWSLTRGKIISETLFYNIYSDLLPYKDSITLLGESPLASSWTKWSDFKKKIASSTIADSQWQNMYTKKFIVIQNGCDNYCSFCLTVQKRWPHKNRSREDIVQEINEFCHLWGKEIVLTWVNIAARWCTNTTKIEESRFTELLQYILDKTPIPRIRISSLWPEYLDDDFFIIIENPRILPHFHLSIQSFSDAVLKRMRRNYDGKRLDVVLTKLAAVNTSVPVSVGADIIVWFPWETEEEFQETLQSIEKYKINKVHAFPFSDHHIGEQIPASLLPNQVDQVTKKQREKLIKKIADILAQEFYQLNSSITHTVLVEGNFSGWTENYIKVPVDSKYTRGEIIPVVL